MQKNYFIFFMLRTLRCLKLRTTGKQKTSPKSYKTEIKMLAYPWSAYSGFNKKKKTVQTSEQYVAVRLDQGGKRPGGETGSPLLGQCVMRRRTGTSAPSALPVQLMAAKNHFFMLRTLRCLKLRTTGKQKTSPKSYKTEIKMLANPWSAYSGFNKKKTVQTSEQYVAVRLDQGGKRPGGETGSPLLGQCVMRRRTGTSAPSALPVQLMAAKNHFFMLRTLRCLKLRTTGKQKTSPKSYKTEIKMLANPWSAYSGFNKKKTVQTSEQYVAVRLDQGGKRPGGETNLRSDVFFSFFR